jgi:GT2 family glycosyltransferase
LWFVHVDRPNGKSAPLGAHAQDARIRSVLLEELTRTDGTWIPPGRSEYLVLLNPDTLLAPDALGKLAPVMSERTADWIYSDDDRRDSSGKRCDPYFKGAFSPELALTDDYATRLAVVRRQAIHDAGGLQSNCREAQIYDLLLRIVGGGGTVKHATEVACHRRSSVPPTLGPHHRAAAERLMADRGIPASIHLGRRDSPSTFELQDIVWPRDLVAAQQVTIVIPTRDRVDLLARCIESIRRTVDLDRVRLLVVDDRSQHEETHRYLAMLVDDPKLRCRVLRPVPAGEPFNYARIMNAGSREVETDLMLHLNNDIEAISPGWLDRMTGWLAFADIGIVGAKLLYPDGSIQHAGVIVSPNLGAPGHLFAGLIGSDMGYQWLPHRVRNVSAVTGACLLTRTALFHELGGFDEEHLAVQFNDTDYCLRAIGAGKRVVYEPSAVLLHRESSSRGKGYDYRETLYFLEKYRDYQDPYASPRLDPGSVYGPTPLVAS